MSNPTEPSTALAKLLAEHRDEILRHVADLVSRPRRRWLTVREACEHAGISDASLRRMMRAGRLTAHRPTPQRILIDVDELDTAIRATAHRVRRLRAVT